MVAGAQVYMGQERIDMLCREKARDKATGKQFGPCPGDSGYRSFRERPGALITGRQGDPLAGLGYGVQTPMDPRSAPKGRLNGPQVKPP